MKSNQKQLMRNYSPQTNFYSLQNTAAILGIVVLYFLVSYLLVGFKTDQVILAGIFCLAYFGTITSRKFIIGFSIFIVYWILFDYMKAFPNYNFNTVHIMQLHNAEQALFGIHQNNTVITPNEFWLTHTSTFLDVMAGIFYLCWIPVPMAFAAYLFFTDKKTFLHFALTFVLVNMIGFVIYYVYPAAPPWYVQKYGAFFIAHTPGNSAGLQRFDDFFNAGIFKSIYAKGSNVFAAMPSLHSSYPLIVFYYGLKKKMGWFNIIFAIVMVGIWFAAVYTSHHYVLDVIAGITCAAAGILFFQKILLPAAPVKKFIQHYLIKI